MRVDLHNEGYDKIYIALFTPGVVATEFGVHSIGGGPDNRTLPGAQPVEEVVNLIAGMIERPEASVDVYSREVYHTAVAAYYGAEDVRVIESKAPWASPAFSAAAISGNTHK